MKIDALETEGNADCVVVFVDDASCLSTLDDIAMMLTHSINVKTKLHKPDIKQKRLNPPRYSGLNFLPFFLSSTRFLSSSNFASSSFCLTFFSSLIWNL